MTAARKKKDPMPHDLKPMLARLARAPFDRPGWIFEIKWDGYRALTEKRGRSVRLYSRKGTSFNAQYPSLVEALASISGDYIMDGEIVALADGKPDFHALQTYGEKRVPLCYAAFDLLYHNGRDLRGLPLYRRKAALGEMLPKHPQLLFSEGVERHGTAFFKAVRERNLEGMVAKDAQSRYLSGVRSDAWQKVKSQLTQEAVIVGFTEPRGSRKYLGALVLAARKNGALTYIGHSGGGFTERELRDLSQKLKKLVVKTPPIPERVPVNSPITWVKPRLVCEVQFTEWTPEGRMRHPIYKGLRPDKGADEVVREMPPAQEVPFSNRDKVFWPEEGYTKGDVIDYYDRMAGTVLPYLHDRPENLNRHPNGYRGKSFYQKDITAPTPGFVKTEEIWSESNDAHIRYLLCQNKETLLYMANLGCIEINPWNSRIGHLDTPDYLILDLDPGNNTFEELIEVAQEVHRVLALALREQYVKTSGKTGMHIVVPLGARYSYEDVKNFAELIARIVHARLPALTSVERSPAKRRDKIYLDFLQNRRGQTIAAPYSLRPYPGATVSTPLLWREVRKGLDPAAFTIETIFKRLKEKGDLWHPVLEERADLAESIRYLEREVARAPELRAPS